MDNTQVVWVPTNKVIPNPLNPRKNESINSEEMARTINLRGWEEPLVCYKKGKFYVLLAGHRRLFAAKQASIETIPVYVRAAPQNEQEEIERIASLQSGRVDWEPWDWGTFTYDRWLAWNKPSLNSFARNINLKPSAVKQYVEVLNYFPHREIEPYVLNKTLTFSPLYQLVLWLKALKKHKSTLVKDMGEDMVRKIMLDKLIRKVVDREALRNLDYCKVASENKVQDFLTNKDAGLGEEIGFLNIQKKYNDFRGHMISVGHFQKRIGYIKPQTDLQKDQAIKSLEDLRKQIDEQLSQIKK